MRQTLLQKVWDRHAVRTLPTGQTQLFIGLHLIHEITTAPAFDMLREQGMDVAFPERTFATVDHIVPTRDQRRPFMDVLAEDMLSAVPESFISMKRLIDDGYAIDFGSALRLEQQRCREANRGVTAAVLEARREAVRTRGQAQLSGCGRRARF